MNGTSHSQRLRHKIDLVWPELATAGRAVWTHPRTRELYPEYLFTLHSMVRASVPLMEAAAVRARALSGADPVAAGVAGYLSKHIPDELHHDDWLLADLEMLGRARAELIRRPPSPTVAAMVGSQYYWMFHFHPVALLGYIAVMEGYPPTVERIEELRARTAYPRDAFRTLLSHARLDSDHRDDLDGTLDALPLATEHSTILGLSALQTVHLASAALREIIDRHADETAS